MLLAPPHQLLVGEAAVTAQNDAHARPRLADLADNARHLFDRAIAARNIRTPLPGQQQMPAAEHVERQVAVFVIITMEEPAFLSAVQRNVGIVEIEHDFARRTLMRLQEKLDQQRVNLWPVTIDPVILRCVASGRVLETIERALARQCFIVRPQHRMQLAGQHAECWAQSDPPKGGFPPSKKPRRLGRGKGMGKQNYPVRYTRLDDSSAAEAYVSHTK